MCIGGYTNDRGSQVLLCRETVRGIYDAVNYYYYFCWVVEMWITVSFKSSRCAWIAQT